MSCLRGCMISIDLHGEPVPQKRPRFSKKGQFVHIYDAQAKLKEGYKWQIRSQYNNEPIGGPVLIVITFFMPIPKSTSGIKKRQMLNGRIHHIKKPDIDNLQKFIFDCLNELVLRDDAQIVEVKAKKIYSTKPETKICIIPLDCVGGEIEATS